MADTKKAHKRWVAQLNRSYDDANYVENWSPDQCGTCIHWMPLAGTIGLDWGVCANAASAFDRTAMFEHDGCDFFERDPKGWRTPTRYT